MASDATKTQAKSKVVILNGVSSVGKTTLAKAIQRRAQRAMLHVQMDDFLEMLPERAFGSEQGLVFERLGSQTVDVNSGELVDRLLAGMRRAIASMAECGNDVIVDDVFFGDEDTEYRQVPEKYELHFIGLFAPRQVLQQRERERGDREIGLALGQFERVHEGRTYDLTFDTSLRSPDETAEEVCDAFSL